jgi:hypothetical protein
MVVGTDGHLYHRWENAAGSWSGWFDHLGNFAGSPILGRRFDGGLEVFCAGTDDWVWHKFQPGPNGPWGVWLTDLAIYHLHHGGQVGTDRHFYTSSRLQRDALMQGGWENQGIAGYGLPSAAAPGAVPLTRWFKELSNDHYYTTSPSVGYGYGPKEVVCYVYGAQLDGVVPLFAHYRNFSQNHVYTTNGADVGGYGRDTPPIACWLGAGL